ncbi:hypothetical protein L3081_02115 [Colwellia sp. MSW7]|uniref:Uncharacterized protein n=1 Tax=Colwellia maritima TaxID=2912588 RepID=A0ABS9WWR8_9GAMM|nr:hypothetical protein [Colwellia maritima]MCI2282412.1 hypothetical protein [Colwellia maritima]
MPNNIALCYSSNNTYPVDRNNPKAFADFKRDNPNISDTFISAGTPFILRNGSSNASSNSKDWRQVRPDLICPLNHMKSLPPQAKRKIALMDSILGGEYLQALADFFQTEMLGAVGAASTALESRLSNFAKAAKELQEALEDVRKGVKAKLPKAQIQKLEQHVHALSKDFNRKFQTEINKFIGRVKSKKGTVYSDSERGVNKAKSGKGVKPIQFTSTKAFNNLRAFEKSANVVGKSLIVLDAGLRANAVHNDYLAGHNWQKRAAVEVSGFGLATAGGLWVGGQAVTGRSWYCDVGHTSWLGIYYWLIYCGWHGGG